MKDSIIEGTRITQYGGFKDGSEVDQKSKCMPETVDLPYKEVSARTRVKDAGEIDPKALVSPRGVRIKDENAADVEPKNGKALIIEAVDDEAKRRGATILNRITVKDPDCFRKDQRYDPRYLGQFFKDRQGKTHNLRFVDHAGQLKDKNPCGEGEGPLIPVRQPLDRAYACVRVGDNVHTFKNSEAFDDWLIDAGEAVWQRRVEAASRAEPAKHGHGAMIMKDARSARARHAHLIDRLKCNDISNKVFDRLTDEIEALRMRHPELKTGRA